MRLGIWLRARRQLCWASFLVVIASEINAPAQTTTLYSTGYEPLEGFDITRPLAGQGGWVSLGSDNNVQTNGNGIVTNLFKGDGQQAYVGFTPLTGTNDSLAVWRPINFDPVAAGKPIVKFSASMAIFDSTTNVYDYFDWSVFNTNNGGERLFTLDFDNDTLEIYYLLDDDRYVYTGSLFETDGIYDLEVTMNFASNLWSASLKTSSNATVIVDSRPITTKGAALNLGDIDAVWIYGPYTNAPGDNRMVFDNFRITADAGPIVPFQLASVGRLANGTFLLRLQGESTRKYAIEATSDFVSWTALRTNIAGLDGTFDFADTSAGAFTRRFYRGRFVP